MASFFGRRGLRRDAAGQRDEAAPPEAGNPVASEQRDTSGPRETPAELVRAAIAAGLASPAAIAARTGLRAPTVELVMERLERTGELHREILAACSAGSCASCGAQSGCGGRGPVLLTLR